MSKTVSRFKFSVSSLTKILNFLSTKNYTLSIVPRGLPLSTFPDKSGTQWQSRHTVHASLFKTSDSRSVHGKSAKGFTLLIAVILAAVILAIGLALLDIAYKQVLLSSAAKNSQYAFYAADAALECALYYDQQVGSFPRPPGTPLPSPISCTGQNNISVSITNTVSTSTSSFSIPCAGGGNSASVQVAKSASGLTIIYSYGYNVCGASDPHRIERGIKVSY